ncbi:MAG: elongation factor G [Spirochaetales bacterium]|nr:elongation factor G [Spirochaetales bacterium]
MSITTEKIRNISIAGHGFTGKTTLVEQILFLGGAIPKPEKVESGKSTSDFTEEEIAKKMSIYTSLTHVNWQDTKINLLDTPGAGDFVGEVIAALRASESALVIVCAESGVQIETIKLWRKLRQNNKPRMVMLNKLDKEHAKFEKTLDDLQEKFKENFVPVSIPIGEGNAFKGVIDLIDQKAYLTEAPGKAQEIPADMKDTAEEYRMKLIEIASEGDDALTEKYLEQETLTTDEIWTGLTKGLKNHALVPVFSGAGLLNAGVQCMLDVLSKITPCPEGEVKGKTETNTETTRKINAGEPFSAFIFKTSIDQFSGKLSYIKVISGKVASDSELYNSRAQKKEKVAKIYTCQGKKLEDTDGLIAGDIGILAKLTNADTNDTLSDHSAVIAYEPLNLPQPVYSIAISAKAKKDEDKLNQMLIKASQEDLTFKLHYNKETKESVISSMGELHLSIILNKIKENNKIDMETRVPKVAYRETITTSANAEYQHKKQSGGHGQYAKVVLDAKPITRGEYFKFSNAVFGGAVSKGYMAGVEKGILEGMEEGILAGYPVVDLEATIVDGKEHPVDSSEMAFKLASRGAIKAILEKAKCVLLEPVMNLEVFVDEQFLGDVLSDLSSRRGKVQGQEPIGGGILSVKAQVPQSELLRYSIDLKSITSGSASFEMEFSHYNPISGKVADDVVKAAQQAKEAAAK